MVAIGDRPWFQASIFFQKYTSMIASINVHRSFHIFNQEKILTLHYNTLTIEIELLIVFRNRFVSSSLPIQHSTTNL